MKIVVLGGAGLTGQCAVRDLAENRNVSEVVIADIDSAKAKTLVDRVTTGNLSATHVDLRNHEATAKILKGADVALNAATYYFNLDVMEAALMAKVHYVDHGGLSFLDPGGDYSKFRQLKLHDRFKEAGLTAIPCMGNCTGISNVMARYIVDKLDSVETILVRDSWKDFTKGVPPFLVTWSIETIMDEFLINPVIFEDGQRKEIQPLSRKDVVQFPEPVGTQEVYPTIHSEPTTFPVSFRHKGIKNCNWMEGGPGFSELKALAEAGFKSDDPVEVDGKKVSPRMFLRNLLASRKLLGFPEGVTVDDYETTRVQAMGLRDGKRITHTVDWIGHSRKEWGASASEYLVGVPSSITAQMLAQGRIEQKGVLLPEVCIDPKEFIAELVKRPGIKIIETIVADMN